MNQTILGLSGPPRAGKDSIAALLCELIPGTTVLRMSTPLKNIAQLYILADERDTIEERKDEPLNPLGTTYRELQIGAWLLGRDLMGEDWLGHHLLAALPAASPLIIIPDFGRLSEVQVLIHSGLRVLQITVTRPGTTFAGDSREYFTIPGPSNSFSFGNDGSLTDLRHNVIAEILPWLEQACKVRPLETSGLAPTTPGEQNV